MPTHPRRTCSWPRSPEVVDPQEARRHLAHARYYHDGDRERLREGLEEVRRVVGAATASTPRFPAHTPAKRPIASRGPSAREWFQVAALRFFVTVWTILSTVVSLAFPLPPLIASALCGCVATALVFSDRYLPAAVALGAAGAATPVYASLADSVGNFMTFAVPPVFLACASAEQWFRRRRRRGQIRQSSPFSPPSLM
jgi:hypothetical protein